MTERLIDDYDVAFFDLDGVIYLGPMGIPGAAEGVRSLKQLGKHVVYVTNNASRSAETVAAQLRSLGFEATAADFVTSAQAASRLLAAELLPGSRVLVAGTENLVNEVRAAGMVPVTSADDAPDAVIQGYDPHMTWARLDEAAVAIQRGARWFATNTDSTRPTERGEVPGAGAMVAAVGMAVDASPTVIGKPYRPLLDEAVRRSGANRPIFVGDRIDTDIIGACGAGMDSILVFTGVHGKADLLAAPAGARPTTLGWGVPSLLEPPRVAECSGTRARCRKQSAHVEAGVLVLDTVPAGREEQLDALWAMAQLAWCNEELDCTSALGSLTEIH